MRKRLIIFSLLLSSISLAAQEGKSAFEYLLIPNSVRTSALGGNNVSLIENDISLIYQNPAFLGQEMDKTIGINYLSFIGDIGMGSVTFGKAIGERSSWGIGAYYTNYGNMLETTDERIILGDLTANDICGQVFFSSDLTEKIRGGISTKFLYSNYADYTSIGIGVDLGISYYDADSDFSFGIVGKNIGRQVKAYDEELSGLPWDIQMGISKRLAHAPIRFSVTAIHLRQWQFHNLQGEEDPFMTNLLKHLVFGVDILPSDNLWLSVGYNVKRGADLNLSEGNRMAGFSIGAGLKVKSFSFGCSVAQYHPSATSFMINISKFLGNSGL